MKCLSALCSMLVISSCGHTTGDKDQPAVDTLSLTAKVLTIADGLPLLSDSADAFISRLFVPSDSLKTTVYNGFKVFHSKTLIVTLHPGDSISYVELDPTVAYLYLPLEQLATKMDSAWCPPRFIFLHKDPRPTVMAYYTDPQHRKKEIEIQSLSWQKLERDSLITTIRIHTARLPEY